jgi:hypothetical protein
VVVRIHLPQLRGREVVTIRLQPLFYSKGCLCVAYKLVLTILDSLETIESSNLAILREVDYGLGLLIRGLGVRVPPGVLDNNTRMQPDDVGLFLSMLKFESQVHKSHVEELLDFAGLQSAE